MFAMLCDHHHYSVPEHFQHPKQKPCTNYAVTTLHSFLPPHSPCQPLICTDLYTFAYSKYSIYKESYKIFFVFGFLHLAQCLQSSSMWQHVWVFYSFYGWIIWIYYILFIYSSVDGQLVVSTFRLFAHKLSFEHLCQFCWVYN